MGFVNILLYDSVPEDFKSWSAPNYNYIDDTKSVKEKIFNTVFGDERKDSIVIVISTDSFSKVLFNCGQRNDCNQNCTQKYKPNCCAVSTKYYDYVKCRVKRKLKGLNNDKINCCVLLYDNCCNKDVTEFITYFVNSQSRIIIAEHKDLNTPMVQNVVKYAKAQNVKEIVSCGNPLDWDRNYIGKNTKVLYRK